MISTHNFKETHCETTREPYNFAIKNVCAQSLVAVKQIICWIFCLIIRKLIAIVICHCFGQSIPTELDAFCNWQDEALTHKNQYLMSVDCIVVCVVVGVGVSLPGLFCPSLLRLAHTKIYKPKCWCQVIVCGVLAACVAGCVCAWCVCANKTVN